MDKSADLTFNISATTNQTITSNIRFSTQDEGTAKLTFFLFKDGVALPLNAVTGKLALRMIDGSKFVKTVTIVDKVNGIAEYILTTEELKHYGKINAELYLNYDNNQKMSVHRFSFVIEQALIDADIAVDTEFYVDDFYTMKEAIETIATETQTNVDLTKEKADEIISLIAENDVAKKSELETTNAQLATKVESADFNENKAEVSAQLTAVSNVIVSIDKFPRLVPEIVDTFRFQRAMDWLESIGGGLLFLAAVEYVLGQVKIPSYVGITGIYRASILKMADNTNKPMLVLKSNTTQMVCLTNFIINGNKDNQTSSSARGVEFINTTDAAQVLAASNVGEHDCRHLINDIYIFQTKGDGFYIEGRGESQIHKLQTLNCEGVGIYANSADTWYNDCSAGNSGLEGIIQGVKATNNHFDHCKSWFSGRVDASRGVGLLLLGDRATLTICEAQDNSKHGFVFSGKDIEGSGLMAEANGWQYATGSQWLDGTGFLFYGAENCNIHGVAADRFANEASGSHQTFAVQFSGGAKNNFVCVTSRNMKAAAIPVTQLNVNNNRYIITEIKVDGTSKQRVNFQHLNINMDNPSDVTAVYTRSLQTLGHQYGHITRFDTDEEESVMHRWEKYNAAGVYKGRWDFIINHATKNAKLASVDGGWLEIDSILKVKDSAWNGKHFMLGGFHLWIDSKNVMRYKSNTPTSEFDGLPLGDDGVSSISSAPTRVRQMATVNGIAYIAVGTSSPDDWKQITN